MGRGNRADTSVAQQAILYRRFLLCAGAGGLGISTGYMELVATVEAALENDGEPPAPTALGGCQAWCAPPQRPDTVILTPWARLARRPQVGGLPPEMSMAQG